MTCMTGDTSHKKLRANVTLISSDIMTVFMKSASKDLSWHKIYANWSMWHEPPHHQMLWWLSIIAIWHWFTVLTSLINCIFYDIFMMWLCQSENCFHSLVYEQEGHILEVKDVGARQSLELLVPLPDWLATHATVELQLFYTLQELHHLLSELILLLPATVDALRQAVYLQRTQLWKNTWATLLNIDYHWWKAKKHLYMHYVHCGSIQVIKVIWMLE